MVEAYNNRGSAYHNKDLYNRAILDFNKAIAINPNYAEAYYNKAIVYERLGNFREVLKAYNAFIENATPQDTQHIRQAQQRIRKLER